jgi:hypothetical protein
MKITQVQVWAREIDDHPGGLAGVLRAIGDARGDVECVIARREPSVPGKGQVFVTLAKGRKSHDATGAAGLKLVEDVVTLRVEGPDSPGLGGRLTHALEKAQVNVRGVSAAALGGNFVCYIGLDSIHDAQTAIPALKHVKGGPERRGGRAAGATARKAGTRRRRAGAATARRATTKRATTKRRPAKAKRR